jgi:hypothetical protein
VIAILSELPGIAKPRWESVLVDPMKRFHAGWLIKKMSKLKVAGETPLWCGVIFAVLGIPTACVKTKAVSPLRSAAALHKRGTEKGECARIVRVGIILVAKLPM